jgi:hypothetical protein
VTIKGNSDGTISLVFDARETADFEAGKEVRKLSGDCRGPFRVVVKLSYIRNAHIRQQMGYPPLKGASKPGLPAGEFLKRGKEHPAPQCVKDALRTASGIPLDTKG